MDMKIEGLGTRQSMLSMSHDANRRTNAMESDFSSELEDQRSSASHEQLQRLLDQIDEQGAKLTKTPTYDELREYRSLIKNFVSSVVSQMYDVSSQTGWDRMGRQKVYTTVRKIDTELENMAEKIRLGQAEQLDVVASHDAIRGMLVDLYM
ncbi:YaaR family protein [Anaerovibrio sp.]|uniref:YaaR family protein n=1 Tax=Anaerovibrio sp. TaxID=1872532 RepID=UPI0025B993A6|nr:YaaR family protein [Anaerovibrio sp.]